MQSVTSATAVATTAHANNITLFASLELSKSKWVVTINSPGTAVRPEGPPVTHHLSPREHCDQQFPLDPCRSRMA